jgi:hypothetical protein
MAKSKLPSLTRTPPALVAETATAVAAPAPVLPAAGSALTASLLVVEATSGSSDSSSSRIRLI